MFIDHAILTIGQRVVGSVILGVSLVACATPELTLNLSIPSLGVPRLPLVAALVLVEKDLADIEEGLKFMYRDRVKHTVPNYCGSGRFRVPLGKVLEEGTRQALFQLVDDHVVVKTRGAALGQFDLLIEASSPVLIFEGSFLLPCTLQVRGGLTIQVMDKTGKLLYQHEYTKSSRRIEHERGDPTILLKIERAGREIMESVFRDVIYDLSSTAALRLYAESVVAQAGGRARMEVPRVARTSDVDEPPAARTASGKNRYAVVIGIEQYRDKLPKADFANRDAFIMAQYLIKVLGYPEENVKVLVNEQAALTDLTKYLEDWLPNNVPKDGSVFVYYSGHGAPEPKSSSAYLVPYDGNPAFLTTTGYPLDRLYEVLDKLPAKEIIVALDSCFSGAGGRSVLAKGARPMGLSIENPVLNSSKMVVLAASSGIQISSTYEEQAHGLFTYFFLKGLQKEADVNKDGTIELNELYDYMKPRVEDVARKIYNNQQTPQLIASPEWIKSKKVKLAEFAK